MKDSRSITLSQLLDQAAAAYPNNDALVYPERSMRYTYKEFREACNQVAKGLLKLGIKKGDHIAVWATNLPEWAIAQFGIARIGAVLVTVNTSYKTSELEYLLKQSDATTLIMLDSTKNIDYPSIIYELCPELYNGKPGELVSEKLPFLKNVIVIGDKQYPGMFTWNEVIKMGEDVSNEELAALVTQMEPDDVNMMIYTSGTTGFPKGVMLTHNNVILNSKGMAECMNLRVADRVCIPVPFFHCFGAVAGTICSVAAGAAMVLPSERFDPVKVLKSVEKERCTVLHGVPTIFIMLLEQMEKEKFDTSSLRTGIVAGASCELKVLKKIESVLNMREVVNAYGQTEASPCITQTRIDDPPELRLSTVGRPLPGVEVKIVDPATEQEAAPGVQGEIRARGYNVMKGYYKMPAATAEAIDEDGWLHTGDLGIMDYGGFLKITCRLKDMIIRCGENIYPREIENYLCTHPLVKEAQVLGVPSPKYGEDVVAFVQLKEGAVLTQEELQDFCKGKIAGIKIPSHIEFVDSYPYTASGKVQKFKLRRLGIKSLGLEDVTMTETVCN